MINEAMAPLFECLIGSDEIRLVAPNSIGVATRVEPFMRTSPAYHLYLTTCPGAAVCFCATPVIGSTLCSTLKPTLAPSLVVTSYSTSCGCRPTWLDGFT